MIRLGFLMSVVSTVLLFAIIVIPVLPFWDNNETIDRYLEPLICQPGEQIIRDLYSYTDSDGTSYSMNVYCMDRLEQRRDETARWAIIGGVAFTIPFLIGLFAFISGANRRKRAQSSSEGAIPVEMLFTPANADKSLSKRLKEIQDARDSGLISADEYERLRQEILDEGV